MLSPGLRPESLPGYYRITAYQKRRRQVQLCLFRLVYIVGLALRLVAGTYDLVFEDELADEALRFYDFGAWYLVSCSTIVWTRRAYLIDWLISTSVATVVRF
jgi:hypothetical protein